MAILFKRRVTDQTLPTTLAVGEPAMSKNGQLFLGTTDFGVINFMPTGVILPYGGSTAPIGWTICDGKTLNRTLYAGLYGAIGTTYGTGDGSTTFTIPDFRGRIAVGAGGNGYNLGTVSGAATVSHTHTGTNSATALSVAQMPSHNHSYAIKADNSTATSTSFGATDFGGATSTKWTYMGITNAINNYSRWQATMNNTGSGATHTHSITNTATSTSTMQPAVGINYIIKL